MPKLPAIQIYPGDWKKDPAVRVCSIAARGLWFEILLSMFDCPERGILKTGDQAWGLPEIAAAAGIPISSAANLLAELEKNGVFSRREPDGAIINRRMVRDEEVRRNANDRVKRFRNADETRMKHASSFSVSPSDQNTPLPPAVAGEAEKFFEWAGQTVAVQMGRRRRLPNLSAYSGGRASDVAEFLNRQGFPARVVSVQ